MFLLLLWVEVAELAVFMDVVPLEEPVLLIVLFTLMAAKALVAHPAEVALAAMAEELVVGAEDRTPVQILLVVVQQVILVMVEMLLPVQGLLAEVVVVA